MHRSREIKHELMRGHINPHSSSAHRVACLTLYRGLLKQAARLNDAETASIVAGHVRRRFKLDKGAQSITIICNGLSLGRKYFDIIRDAANGSDSANTRLQETVAAVGQYTEDLKTLRVHQAKLRSPTRPAKLKKIAHLEKATHKRWTQKIPDPIPIFDRPVPKEQLPDPDQPRRVPHLASGHGIPFLRYKSGSQPIELSRTIRSMHKQDDRRWENIYRMQRDTAHAMLEDDWDNLLRVNAHSRREESNDQVHPASWTTSARETERDLLDKSKKAGDKRRDTANRMFEIVKQEKALATKEREERKKLAREKWEREQQNKSVAAKHGQTCK